MEDLLSYEHGQGVLFVGEGNFSFSVSVTKLWCDQVSKDKLANVIATCYETAPTGDNSENNVAGLESMGIKVMLGVDATKLEDIFEPDKFDKVIFMFPHVGGKMKIQLNRDLLKRFSLSVAKVLNPERGQVFVALCNGQGGTPFDSKQRLPADSWQVVKMMSFGNLGLIKVGSFDTEPLPDYKSFGYRSLDKGFHADGGTVHVFKLGPHLDEDILYPPQYEHDLSYWLPPGQSTPQSWEDFKDVINESSSGNVTSISKLDAYHCSKTDRRSETIRLQISSTRTLISPQRAVELVKAIGEALTESFHVDIR